MTEEASSTSSPVAEDMQDQTKSQNGLSGRLALSLRQPSLHHERSLRAKVPRSVLEGGGAGPFRRGTLRRFFRSFLPREGVLVEPRHARGLAATVLYAAETAPVSDDCPFAETQLTSGPPTGDLVYNDSDFEIRASGMLVANFDRWVPAGSADNELLLYSVQCDPEAQGTGDNAESLPFIHFDHRSDAYTAIDRPNTFIPVPASKAYVTGSNTQPCHHKKKHNKHSKQSNPGMSGSTGTMGSSTGTGKPKPMRSVNVQFKILELDEPSETVKQAISRIDELGGVINSFAVATPALGILSPALSVAGSVSKRALDSYARPDKVISIDMDFLLADRARVAAGTSPPGEYLRYGYYFFLAQPMEGKLYASILTPKNVQLMLHRDDGHTDAEHGGRRFFPLTQVSYLVVRVSEPTCASAARKRRPIQMAHARELEEIFTRSRSTEDPEKVKLALKELGQKLGMLDSDSEEDDPGEQPTLVPRLPV